MSSTNDSTTESNANEVPIGVIDPMVDSYLLWVRSLNSKIRKTYSYMLFAIIIAISVSFYFLAFIPNIVHVLVGIPLGISLFLVIFGFMNLYQEKKAAEDEEYIPLKLKKSPSQRLRIVALAGVVFLLVSIAVSHYIPYVLGGILTMVVALVLYDFLRKTPYEIELYINNESDPRDQTENGNNVEEDEEPSAEETDEYVELVNSLPEEQRRILLNPKLNGALAVIDEDDLKNKKNRKLFRKKVR